MSAARPNAGDSWTVEDWEAYRSRYVAACERFPGAWVENIGRACVVMADANLARLRAQ